MSGSTGAPGSPNTDSLAPEIRSARGVAFKGWIIAADSTSWQSLAAYLYVLRLDGPSLAWEYLRRNLAYRDDWTGRHHQHSGDPASRWHLETFEDPKLDARVARPVWRLDRGQRVKLQAADALSKTVDDPERFSLWAIPGSKRLVHDGRHVLLSGFAGNDVLHLALGQDVRDGMPFDYVLSPGPQMRETWRDIEKQRGLLAGQKVHPPAASTRPSRLALMHMRALQALDGSSAGASQREIAGRLFGDESVAQNWHPDSELRAQVRHLIRRARAFAVGGYRTLISRPPSKGR